MGIDHTFWMKPINPIRNNKPGVAMGMPNPAFIAQAQANQAAWAARNGGSKLSDIFGSVPGGGSFTRIPTPINPHTLQSLLNGRFGQHSTDHGRRRRNKRVRNHRSTGFK